MNFDKNIAKSVNKTKAEPFEERLNRFLIKTFEDNNEPDQRLKFFLDHIKAGLAVDEDSYLNKETVEEIKANLKVSCEVETLEDFMEKSREAIQPLIEWSQADPVGYEAALRKDVVETFNFIPLNEMLTYGMEKDSIHIHVSPSNTIPLAQKISLLHDGLKKLAKILEENPHVKEITATSWIVASHPELLEKLGFTVIGEISKEEKDKHFKKESRLVAKSFISREDFLSKYG